MTKPLSEVTIPLGMDCRGLLPNYRGFSIYLHFSPWKKANESCQVCYIRRNYKQCNAWLFVKNVAFCEKHKDHPRAVALLNKCKE